MPRVVIDNQAVEMPEGGTILDAARKLGMEIPTLCFLEGLKPATSCMVCIVRLKGTDRMVPSCATLVEDGMEVESETEEVHNVRRTGLELLLSDHVGDCTAPCQTGCPAHMDIPLMLRQVATGNLRGAIATIKQDIALPAILGRICPEPCESGCRRREVDSPAAICQVKRYVADADLASDEPYLPECKPASGKKVAIVGAGATGLSAAWHLAQAGHRCVVFDEHDEPGGSMRYDPQHSGEVADLPAEVLDAEIAVIAKLGLTFRLGVKVGGDRALADLQDEFDAVLIATGPVAEGADDVLGLPVSRGRVQADARTHKTETEGVFAAGSAVQPSKLAVRSVAQGKAAAFCIDQHLAGEMVTGPPRTFDFRSGRLDADEIAQLSTGAARDARVVAGGGADARLTDQEAQAEASRCLHCDCGKQNDCRLRYYAAMYGAKAGRFRGKRRKLERHLQHGDVVYEPGKCIMCGLCVQIATEAGEPLGLTFVGRGFDVRVDVPFDRSIADGLTRVARECVQACPTGALAFKADRCSQAASCSACSPPRTND